jgi:hypothetical protein
VKRKSGKSQIHDDGIIPEEDEGIIAEEDAVPAEHGHSHNKRAKAVNDFRKSIKKETTKEFTVQKIWVCGPPFMSDNFDKDLTSLINERDDELQRKLEKHI